LSNGAVVDIELAVTLLRMQPGKKTTKKRVAEYQTIHLYEEEEDR
jgi:hypothetical protein